MYSHDSSHYGAYGVPWAQIGIGLLDRLVGDEGQPSTPQGWGQAPPCPNQVPTPEMQRVLRSMSSAERREACRLWNVVGGSWGPCPINYTWGAATIARYHAGDSECRPRRDPDQLAWTAFISSMVAKYPGVVAATTPTYPGPQPEATPWWSGILEEAGGAERVAQLAREQLSDLIANAPPELQRLAMEEMARRGVTVARDDIVTGVTKALPYLIGGGALAVLLARKGGR